MMRSGFAFGMGFFAVGFFGTADEDFGGAAAMPVGSQNSAHTTAASFRGANILAVWQALPPLSSRRKKQETHRQIRREGLDMRWISQV